MSASSTHLLTEPGFFAARSGAPLFGVWRASAGEPSAAWVICPPFGEEEKSAHRTLVELCDHLRQRGESSLCFGYSGTADSSGEFVNATLTQWRDDIGAACDEVRSRAPQAPLGLIGLRLGASLALQTADDVGASRLVLIEPVLGGRSYLGAMSQRKKLRAMMTQNDAANNQNSTVPEGNRVLNAPASDSNMPITSAWGDAEDLDGWPLAPALRDELNALDLMAQTPSCKASTLIMQAGPRETLAAPLQKLAEKTGAVARAVVMKPFWNLLDYERGDALFDEVLAFRF